MKHTLITLLSLLAATAAMEAQSFSDIFPSVPSDRPLVSYQVGDKVYTSLDADAPVKVSAETLEYSTGLKASVKFENVSGEKIMLHNIVPFGAGEDHVYISGLGDHGLSRTQIFRPGYGPVNIIVPDNAWELGMSMVQAGGRNVVALTRRNSRTIQGGYRSRFENFLEPGGSICFNLWADFYEGEWQNGLELMFRERYLYDVEPGTFDDTMYRRDDLKWARKCYSSDSMMAWDRRFYDIADGQFHIDEFLEKMDRLIGGYDIWMLWPTWPALGMDQRNQWDMFRDLPGGYEKLREITDVCHSHGTHFFTSYMPWDGSTRSDEGHFDGMTTIASALQHDGFVLDTSGSASKELQNAADAAKPGIVLISEGQAVARDMQGIVSGRTHNALYYCPMLNLCKYIRPDFAVFRVAEESHEPIRREFNTSFFNGYGVEISSFSVGRFEWSDEQFIYWGGLLRIQRENNDALTSFGYEPLLPTLSDGIYVNRWPAGEKTLYTVYNLHPEGFNGDLMEYTCPEGRHLVDIYAHKELATVERNGRSVLPYTTESFESQYLGTNNESTVSAFAEFPELLSVSLKGDVLTTSAPKGTSIRIWAGMPSYSKTPATLPTAETSSRLLRLFPGYEGKFIVQLFEDDLLIDERVVMIEPATARLSSDLVRTERYAKAPENMCTIPAGTFCCKEFLTGDSFIPYPEPLLDENGCQQMEKFYMDKYPVTNAQYKVFLDQTGYTPADPVNFLKHWEDGKIPAGQENYPVVYVTVEDAAAYASWAGKRLPTEFEWQYAAATPAGNTWPWKQKHPVKRIEEEVTGTLSVWHFEGIEKNACNLGDGVPYPVGKYPKGRNQYGLCDLVGCVWQLTGDIYDNTTYRYVMVRGGSYYMPSSSWWYVQGGPRELNFRQYLLRVSPSFERKSTVGFRCVADAVQ